MGEGAPGAGREVREENVVSKWRLRWLKLLVFVGCYKAVAVHLHYHGLRMDDVAHRSRDLKGMFGA